MSISVAIFCFLLWNLPHTSSYSDGAPDSQCYYMTPKHGFQPQVSDAPYDIVLDQLEIGPGERIVVKIQSRSGFFKGFMIRAENALVNDGQGVGTWWLNSSFSNDQPIGQYLKCNDQPQSALTHTGKQFSIRVVVAQWEAPVQFEGRIRFRATVVQDYSTFWKDLVSALVIISNPYDVNMTDSDDDVPRQQRHSQDFGSMTTPQTLSLNSTRSSQLQLPPLEDSSSKALYTNYFRMILLSVLCLVF